MKKLVLLLVIQFIISSISGTLPQTNSREGSTIVSFLPQGYGIKLLNSYGTSSILNDVSNLGFMNPANISDFENYSLGFSYQFNTSICLLYTSPSPRDRTRSRMPSSA